MGKRKRETKEEKARRVVKEIIQTYNYIEKELANLPKIIDERIKKIIKGLFRPRDVSLFIVKELFEVYIAADGKQQLIEYFKNNPKEVLKLLTLLKEMADKLDESSNVQNSSSNNNNGVVVQFIGLNNSNEDKKEIAIPPNVRALESKDNEHN